MGLVSETELLNSTKREPIFKANTLLFVLLKFIPWGKNSESQGISELLKQKQVKFNYSCS